MRDRVGLVARLARRDLGNIRAYGPAGPRFAQRIWVDPHDCETSTAQFGPHRSGEVLAGSWDRRVVPTDEPWDMQACRRRWLDGASWEETGAFEQLLLGIASMGGRKDGCRTLEDVRARYEQLDRLYEQVRREGRLRSRAELPGRGFRERGGVLVHVGSRGQPVFGRHGCHRMAIARIVGLHVIPAQVGVIHPGGLDRWPEIAEPPSSSGRS